MQLLEPPQREKYARRLSKGTPKWIGTIAGMKILSVSLPILEKVSAARVATQIYRSAQRLRKNEVSDEDRTLILARTLPWLPEPERSTRLSRTFKELIDDFLYFQGKRPMKALLESAALNLPNTKKNRVATRVMRSCQDSAGRLADLAESLLRLLPREVGKSFLQDLYCYFRSRSWNDEDGEKQQMLLCVILADFGLIEQAIDLAQRIDREHVRSSVLARLVPYFPIARRYEILREALSYLDSVSSDSRRDALCDISLCGELLPEEMQSHLVSLLLRTVANRRRSEIVSEIRLFLPVFRRLAGDEVIARSGGALAQVGRWWL